MESQQINYAIYPSVLDAYLRFKRKDDDETFQGVFNKINHVKTEQTEQQAMGEEFEGCVNDMITCIKTGGYSLTLHKDGYYLTKNFKFKADLVEKIASKLEHVSKKQEYMEAIIPSHLGNIKLYGISDYTFPEMITDLKTTSNYKCNKYRDHAQHPCYSMIRELNGNPLKAFKYLVSDFDKAYQETYIPTPVMHQKLMFNIFEFINFIEYFKKYITDTKIFGGK
jgi:hypothetical protein